MLSFLSCPGGETPYFAGASSTSITAPSVGGCGTTLDGDSATAATPSLSSTWATGAGVGTSAMATGAAAVTVGSSAAISGASAAASGARTISQPGISIDRMLSRV